MGANPKRTPFGRQLVPNTRQGRFLWGLNSPSRGGESSSRNRDGRIVNGKTADYGEWPWQISLRQWRTGKNHKKSNMESTAGVISMAPMFISSHLLAQMRMCTAELKLGHYSGSLR